MPSNGSAGSLRGVTQIPEPRTPFPYEINSFAAEPGAGLSDREAKWGRAVVRGFHGSEIGDDVLGRVAESEARDGRIYTGAYLDQSLPGAWDATYPVATYATHRKTLNVGAGAMLPAHLITAVTVRPSHRRRGILREMITADLAQAKADGLAMAALTASEAIIYGRFGFGAATEHCSVEIDAGHRFALVAPQAATGLVEAADPKVLVDLVPVVFAPIHAGTFGSIDRQDSYRFRAAGEWNYDNPERDKAVRAALHYGPGGAVDGYVSYKFDGWEATPAAVTVVDLLATNTAAYLALWDYVGSLDLVSRVHWRGAPLADPLEWALADKRGYSRKRVEDHLWLRILDVPAALTARHYWADGAVVLSVTDPLGHTDGVYRLSVLGGKVSVEVSSATPADLELGVAELSSLYLANVSARTLAAAGRLTEARPGAAAGFDALFSSPVRAHSWTDF